MIFGTDAETWCHILTYNGKVMGTIVVPVEFLKKRVKKLVKDKKAEIKLVGDNKESQVVLLPIKYIWEDI